MYLSRLCALRSTCCRDTVDAHIGSQDLRNDDRPVNLLIILDQGQPGAAHRKAGAVQRVHEFALATLGLESNAASSRLKGFAIRAGRNFAELIGRWQPDFNIVSLAGGETHVARAEQDDSIMQPELLQE